MLKPNVIVKVLSVHSVKVGILDIIEVDIILEQEVNNEINTPPRNEGCYVY